MNCHNQGWSKERRRDGGYSLILLDYQAGDTKLTPAINWKGYFYNLGFTKVDSTVNRFSTRDMKLQAILAENKVESLEKMPKWTLLNKASSTVNDYQVS
jgi:hypothetical protein